MFESDSRRIAGLTRHFMSFLFIASGFTALPLAVSAQEPSEEAKRLSESMEVVRTLVETPDDAIPQYILDRAEAIVVIPRLVKGGFVVGAQHGRGVMSVRNRRGTNSWSAPSFVALTGGSIGWQIGLQAVDLVLLVMNREGIDDLLKSEFKLGVNASVAAGPVGRSAEASTDARAGAQILAYSRAKGLFAGATIQGASLRDDEDANRRFYGKSVKPVDLFDGSTPESAPVTVRSWRAELKSVINAAASSTSIGDR